MNAKSIFTMFNNLNAIPRAPAFTAARDETAPPSGPITPDTCAEVGATVRSTYELLTFCAPTGRSKTDR